jgi:predicted RNase H-like HicB family nuclease
MISLMNQYTAAIQQDSEFWIGWIEEVPGVNSQGATREELLENLRLALREALEMNRKEALNAAGDDFEEPRFPHEAAPIPGPSQVTGLRTNSGGSQASLVGKPANRLEIS